MKKHNPDLLHCPFCSLQVSNVALLRPNGITIMECSGCGSNYAVFGNQLELHNPPVSPLYGGDNPPVSH